MKNRAKCKLCNDTIESYHSTDYVICKCGEIAVDGGDALYCFAKDFNNFLRVDDQGNEIIVKVKDVKQLDTSTKSSKEDLLFALEETIKSYDNLPTEARYAPVNHSDLLVVLRLLSSLLRT